MNDQTKTFGQAMELAVTGAAASLERSTTGSNTSTGSREIEHKRAFLETFRRWERLFKRKDGDSESDKWLIAEYYKALGHLTVEQFGLLTEQLIRKCVFLPTISECLGVINPPPYSYGHPFNQLAEQRRGADAIGSLAWWGAAKSDMRALTDQREQDDGE